jgi:Tol biopolymer transport system component
VRYGAILGAAVVGLVAGALSFIPLLLDHRSTAEPLPRITTSFWAVPISGGAPQLVARLKGQYAFPVESADGRSLLVLRPALAKTALWALPLNGGRPRWVGKVPIFAEPAWSRDRRLLATARGESVDIVSRKGTLERTLTRQRGNGGLSGPSWAGDRIAIVRESRPAAGWRLDLEVWRAQGGLAWTRRLPFPNPAIALAPDGRRVALVTMHALAVVTQGARRVLATDVQQQTPVWTPDGRSIVYFDTGNRLIVRSVAGEGFRVLVHGRFSEPSVSADGRTVYVMGMNVAQSIPK